MTRARSRILRILSAVIAGVCLLIPGFLVALAWTAVNLKVALLAVLGCVLVAVWLPRWRWTSAAIASVLIAIPPYPYWLFSREGRGWYLHFFHGYNAENLPVARFALVLCVSMVLFAIIFWAIGNRGIRNRQESQQSVPDMHN